MDQTGTAFKTRFALATFYIYWCVGEPTIDTTNVVIVIHDGVTAGGHSMVGEKSVQDIVNKRSIAIGKSEPSDALDAQLDVLGNTLVSDDVDTGGLKVLYRLPLVRTGFTSATLVPLLLLYRRLQISEQVGSYFW